VGGPPAIALIGMPGAGKSTVGAALALRLGRVWLDTDDEIERRLGQPIRAFFVRHGEPAFRDLEHQVVEDLAARRGCVLGTGGGCGRRALRPADKARRRRSRRRAAAFPARRAVSTVGDDASSLGAAEPLMSACDLPGIHLDAVATDAALIARLDADAMTSLPVV